MLTPWNEMSHEQRAFLIASSRAGDQACALVMKQSIALANLKALERARNSKEENSRLAREFSGKVEYLAPGKAYGAGELTRLRAGALAMQFYRKGGGCA